MYWVTLDPVVGSEIRKTRPAWTPGRALGDQIRSIDKRRLKARVGRLTADEMSRVDEAVAITVGLPA
jgi:mRNA interferase MazF